MIDPICNSIHHDYKSSPSNLASYYTRISMIMSMIMVVENIKGGIWYAIESEHDVITLLSQYVHHKITI